MAQVRRPTRTWSPKLEVDGVPIAYDATLRHYHGGHAGLVVEALEQPLLLPKEASSPDSHRTKGAEGPTRLIAERSLLWPKCAVQPALGRLSWR